MNLVPRDEPRRATRGRLLNYRFGQAKLPAWTMLAVYREARAETCCQVGVAVAVTRWVQCLSLGTMLHTRALRGADLELVIRRPHNHELERGGRAIWLVITAGRTKFVWQLLAQNQPTLRPCASSP